MSEEEEVMSFPADLFESRKVLLLLELLNFITGSATGIVISPAVVLKLILKRKNNGKKLAK